MATFASPLGLARKVDGVVIDGLIATALAVATYMQIAMSAAPRSDAIVFGLVTVATVVWRRLAPTAAGITVTVGFVAYRGVAPNSAMVELAAMALVFFTLGERAASGRRELVSASLVWMATVVVAVVGRGPLSLLSELSGWALSVAAPTAIGYVVTRQALLVSRLHDATARLRHEVEERSVRVAAEERVRIARELHDIVAHRVSVMVIHASAIQRIAESRPEAARDSLRQMERAGREALVEMHRVIGVLRSEGPGERGGEADPTNASPGLSDLDILIGSLACVGVDVAVDMRGRARALEPDLDAVAFRVVQEALTNVVRHAGTVSVSLEITYGEQEIVLDITNTTPANDDTIRLGGGGRGFGLVGMGERITALGGRLETGPTQSGGFRVHAHLPAPCGASA